MSSEAQQALRLRLVYFMPKERKNKLNTFGTFIYFLGGISFPLIFVPAFYYPCEPELANKASINYFLLCLLVHFVVRAVPRLLGSASAKPDIYLESSWKELLLLVGVFIYWGLCYGLMYFNPVCVESIDTNTVAEIAKECAVKKAIGELDPKFNKIEDSNYYTFIPADGDCDGDENNLITAQSKKTEKFPTYSYNVETGVKSCSHDGQNKQLKACSARRNGKW